MREKGERSARSESYSACDCVGVGGGDVCAHVRVRGQTERLCVLRRARWSRRRGGGGRMRSMDDHCACMREGMRMCFFWNDELGC